MYCMVVFVLKAYVRMGWIRGGTSGLQGEGGLDDGPKPLNSADRETIKLIFLFLSKTWYTYNKLQCVKLCRNLRETQISSRSNALSVGSKQRVYMIAWSERIWSGTNVSTVAHGRSLARCATMQAPEKEMSLVTLKVGHCFLAIKFWQFLSYMIFSKNVMCYLQLPLTKIFLK